jgi:hypothetical protein
MTSSAHHRESLQTWLVPATLIVESTGALVLVLTAIPWCVIQPSTALISLTPCDSGP